jgi:hypothetical protein
MLKYEIMKKLLYLIMFIPLLGMSQTPEFCDSIIYTSYYNEMKFDKHISHNPEVTFTFNNNVIATTMKDQMSKYRSFGIINKGDDNMHIWKKYSCLDNSGSKVFVTFAYEKPSQVQMVIIDYGNMYMYFEVKPYPIPPKVYDVLDHLEENGYLNDGKFGADYTNEEVKTFISQFGSYDIIMKLLVTNMFITQTPSKSINKYDDKGKLTGKEIQYDLK